MFTGTSTSLPLSEQENRTHEYRNDLWGYAVHTQSDTCISFINTFYHQVLRYGAERRIILQAADADANCVLACALAAAYMLTQQDGKQKNHSADFYLNAANCNLDRATRYERLVLAAVTAWVKGHTREVLDFHFQIVAEFPRDLVSLKRGQVLCFYMGKQEEMLQLALQALPANKESPFIYGMLAFALIEAGGRMNEAEVAARRGLTIDSDDVWSQHALCHVLQHECRYKEALALMAGCSHTWNSCCSFLYTHNWWHTALCELEQGEKGFLGRVLEIYDNHIWVSNDQADCSQDCLNALGLLLRLDVQGHHNVVDARIASMEKCLLNEVTWHQEWLQDLLLVWGLARGGHGPHAKRLLQSLNARVEEMDSDQQKPLQPALTLAKALYEYGVGNFDAVCHLLGRDSRSDKYKAIGASGEQVDVFVDLWCDVFLRTSKPLLVVEVAEHRASERSGVPFNWHILEKAYAAAGQSEKAAIAASRASVLNTA